MRRAFASGVAALAAAVACGGQTQDSRETGSGGGVPTTIGGTESESDSSGTESSESGADKLDVGDGEGNGGDCPGGGGGGTEGEYEFSYIWIANSSEGTVSKVNTFTAIEEARYRTGPGAPDPSRTSVNQYGDVAVANRDGGIAKISTNIENCVDTNANGEIETSTGPADILPWGEDECILWYQDLPASAELGPRPIAWEAVDSQCGTQMPRVWVGFWRGPDDDWGIFRRLDGATGATLDELEVPIWNLGDKPTGPYGGAVNAEGDFFVTGYYGPGIRIDGETLDVEYYEPPTDSGFYGMALGANEDMWIGGCDGAIYHFDNETKIFSNVATIEGRARGVQVDREGRAWFAGNNPCRLLMVDTVTQTLVEDAIDLPGCGEPVGVSIDVEGYVWVVDKDAELAYKVDPNTYAVVATVTGLVDPYTYSDMTGHGLGLVVNPPAG